MRHKSSSEEKPLKTRIKLSAIKLFAVRGIKEVPVRDIVRKAGTTQPMLYYHFGCKDKLCADLYKDLLSALLSGSGRIMVRKCGLEQKLKEVFSFYSNFFSSRPGVARFILQGFLSPYYGRKFRDITTEIENEHTLNLQCK